MARKEAETEAYYDAENIIYLSFWDPQGRVHWGIFYGEEDHITAQDNLTTFCILHLQPSPAKTILDVCCGCGATTAVLGNIYASATGIDLSGTRIKTAKKTRGDSARFIKASVTDLPFDDCTFDDIISQSSLYHVHEKRAAFREIFRVMKPHGRFVFDDMTKPSATISPTTQRDVFDRLHFDSPLNVASYETLLQNTGFRVEKSIDLSRHMATMYARLIIVLEGNIRTGKHPEFHEHYRELISAYLSTIAAVNSNEIGWHFFVCTK